MNASDLLIRLRARGLTCYVNGSGTLNITPQNVLTPELITEVAAATAELIACLQDERRLPIRRLDAILSEPFVPPVYQWPEWCVDGRLYIYAGAGDTMKSWFLLYDALVTAAGLPLLGSATPCLQGPAIFISAENGYDEDRRRIHLLTKGLGLASSLPFYHLDASTISLPETEPLAALFAFVREIKPRLIGIDSAIAVAQLSNENDNAEVQAFMQRVVLPLSRVHGATTKLVAHSPKPPTQKGLVFTDEHVTRGASAWRNAVDGVLYFRREPSLAPGAVVVRPTKIRIGAKPTPFWFTLEDSERDPMGHAIAVRPELGGAVTAAMTEDTALAQACSAAMEMLRGESMPRKELVERLGALKISSTTATRAVAVLRGKAPWPTGPQKGQTMAVVDEERGPRNSLLLTPNSVFHTPQFSGGGWKTESDDEPGF